MGATTAERTRARGGVPGSRARRALGAALLLSAALPSGACSRKLSRGGNALDVLVYDVLKMDRSTSDYYRTVQEAHDRDFCYRCTDDTYLADKSIDAVYRLGDARYDRIEGEMQVILSLSDIVFEARVALERAVAAGSLTRLGGRLEAAPGPTTPERGDRMLARMQSLDALHDPTSGARLQDSPDVRRSIAAGVDEIGSYDLPNAALDKNALRWFPTRAWIVNESDPTIRASLDRAMRRRARALVISTLAGAVQDPSPHVRQAAIEGLQTLGLDRGLDNVLERLPNESAPFVRTAAADYLGAVGGPRAAEALVTLLRDDDGGVRRRARKALTRLAGADLGGDEAAWRPWIARAFPAPAPASTPAPAASEGAAAAAPDPPR